MKDEREVFDELIKKNKYSPLYNNREDIWEMFEEVNGEDIECHMHQYFVKNLMDNLFDNELVEMMNKIFDENQTSYHLFRTVEEYCNWVIDNVAYECGHPFSPYNLQCIIMSIHDNFDEYNDIFDDDIFILQTSDYNDFTPCNIEPINREDIESLLGGNLIDESVINIAMEYYDDTTAKLWYDHYDIISPLYEEWIAKLEELEEEELEEED